jgi:hypothetical protein
LRLYDILPPEDKDKERQSSLPPLPPLRPAPVPGPSAAAPVPPAPPGQVSAPTPFAPPLSEEMQRAERLYRRRMVPEVERSMAGEIGTSLARGAIGLAKFPFSTAKILAADVLGSQTAKQALEPILYAFEELQESERWRASKAAGGPPIELDRIIEAPGEVAQQFKENVTNPRFWAAQVPEAAMSMIPFFAGNLGARMAARALKYGKQIEAIKKSTSLTEMAKLAKIAPLERKIARMGTIGGFGAAMAMEAGEAEHNLRHWEEETGERVDWAARVFSILGSGVVAGALEAISTERIFFGKHGAPSVEGLIRKLFEGKGGTILARKILDSVATEGITEGAQELVQNAFAKIGYDPEQSLLEGIVESVLIGAAVGGLAGTGRVSFQAAKEYGPYIQELKEKAEAERQARLAEAMAPPEAAPEAAPVPEAVPTPEAAPEEGRLPGYDYLVGLPQERPPAITETAPEGGSPLVDQFGRSIYRSAIEEALSKEPWQRNALEKWLVDQARKGEMVRPEAPTRGEGVVLDPRGEPVQMRPQPIGDAADATAEVLAEKERPVFAPEGVSLREKVVQLTELFDVTGDPRVGGELMRLLINNRESLGDLLTMPGPELEGLRPLAKRLDRLIRRVDETGDPKAAEELHNLLVSNLETLQNVSRWAIAEAAGERLLPEPMAPSGQVAPEIAEPTPPEKGPPPETPPVPPEAPAAPEAPTTPEAKQGLPGSTTQVSTTRGTTVDVQYEVIDVKDLTTSHDDALSENPAFPQELQPRDRTRATSEMQISRIEKDPRPELLGENPMASDGAPVIGPDNMVESGNARTIALRRLYDRQDEKIQNYRQWLTDNAARFGLDSAAVAQMENPVLVRRRTTDLDTSSRRQFVREANEPTVASMSATEQARTDAARMAELDLLRLFVPNDRGVIQTQANQTFIEHFMLDVVGPNEAARLIGRDRRLNQDGERRIRNAIFALAYGDTFSLEKLAEATDDMAKNLTGAMMMAAPRLARIDNEIAQGKLFDLSITQEIVQAADIAQSLREQGITIEGWLEQGQLFEAVPPLVSDLLLVFNQLSRSRAKITAFLTTYADVVEAAGNPKQLELLGPRRDINKAEALEATLQKVEQEHGFKINLQPRPSEAPSGEVAPPETGKVEGAEEGPAPEEGGFDLTGGKPKVSTLEARLKEVQAVHPDIDVDKAMAVLRAFPEGQLTPDYVALLVDDELFSQVARGNLSATEREQLYKKHREPQGQLPGIGMGGLFDVEPEAKPATEPAKEAVEKRLPDDNAPDAEWAEAYSRILNEIHQSDFPDKNTALLVLDGRFPQTWDKGAEQERFKLIQALNHIGYDIDPWDQDAVIDRLVGAKEALRRPTGLTKPPTNLEILAGLDSGAWQSFTRPFTDEEVALLERAINEGLVKVKQEKGQTLYGRAGDLRAWLAGQETKPEAAKAPPEEPKAAPKTLEAVQARIAWLDQQVADLKEERKRIGLLPEVTKLDPRRQLKPGDKVWMSWANILGSPTKIHGEVYKGRGMDTGLRVRITDGEVGGARSTGLFDYFWIKEGEKEFAMPEPIREINARIRELEKERQALFNSLPQAAKDDARRSFEKAVREGAEPLDFAAAKVGDRLVNHYDGKVHEIYKIEDDEKFGRFLSLKSEEGDFSTLNARDPDQYYTKVAPEAAPEPKKPKAKPAKINTLDLANEFLPFIREVRNLRETGAQRQIKLNDLINIVKKNYDIENLEPLRKQTEEAFELAIVLEARDVAASHADVVAGLKALEALYNTQPALTSRTSTTIRHQAYSTPAPLAYLMSKWAGITNESWVYEPTAGNGMLLIEANPEQTLANEIDSLRAEHLKSQGYTVTQEDGSSLVGKPKGPPENSVDVVVANPPFGKLDEPVTVDGYKISKKEHLIVIDSLLAMDDDGRAAVIIGGHSFMTPYGQPMPNLTDADRVFFNYLYSHYNVTHHINIDGKVYERMGTKFPIRLLTIDGRKDKVEGAAPHSLDQIEVAKSFNDVYRLLKGDIADARTEGVVAPGVPEGQPPGPGGPGRPGAVTDRTGRGQLPAGVEGKVSGAPEAEERAGHPGGPVAPERRVAVEPERPGPRRPDRGGQVAPGDLGPERAPGVSPRPESGEPGQPPGEVSPRPAERPAQPERTGERAGEPGTGRVSPKSVGSGTKITLPDGTIVTIREEVAPYEAKPQAEQTIEVVDADGNVRRIPISQIAGIIDESGQETKLTEQDRQQIRVFQKNQWVETAEGLVGQVTKIRGFFDKMQLTVKGPDQTVTVKASEIANILPGPPATAPEAAPSPPLGEVVPSSELSPEIAKAEETKLQVPYQPISKGKSMNTVTPRYMAEAVNNYLQKLEGEIGNLDEFVRNRMNYATQEELFEALGAEQVESVALAIDAIERGTGGFVVGHQTGVGKGRVGASIMHYAKNQGLTPIFVTDGDTLFSAMFRDLAGIKSDLNPLIIASDVNRARIVDKDGNVIRNLDLQAVREAVRQGSLPAGYDAVFTTYYQINNKNMTGKMRLLENLAPNSILILDESHKGAGPESNIGTFLRSSLTNRARGVVYSSATYAKRADTMHLYHRTELGNLNVDIDTVIDNLVRGGVPLQEWIAHQWALSGQMVRNELSFAGIDIPVETDVLNKERDVQRSDDLTTCLRATLKFSNAFTKWVKSLDAQLKREGKKADPGFRGGVTNTNFASVMHNKISQLLFCIRADATATEALQALKEGKKVVIGCYNTMESFLNDMLETGALQVGDEVDMNFAQVLRKSLDSTRTYRIDRGFGQAPEKVTVPVEQLPDDLKALWNETVGVIESMTTDVPAMPIDYIAKALIKEGYRVGEITGRRHVMDWKEEKNILRRRSDKEVHDKNTPINEFNSGGLDVLIVNSSAASGIDLHASEKFKDQRPRKMILTQMALDINEVVQLLGRVHRIGQVVLPEYMIKVSALPAEKRPLVVLQKKMASLFANVSAKGESAYSLQVEDIMNQHGDRVIAEMFAEEPELNEQLSGVLDKVIDDDFIQADRDGRVQQILKAFPEHGSLTKRVTGWAALQPVTVQEDVWANIDARYGELVQTLKQMGEFNLESEHLDLQAKTTSQTVLATGDSRGKSELSSPTYFETVEAKVLKKPMKRAEVEQRIGANLKDTPQNHAISMQQQIEKEFEPWIQEKIALMRGANNTPETIQRYEQGARRALAFTLENLEQYQLGTVIDYPLQNMTGVIYSIKYSPTPGSNPATPSNIKISMAVDSTMRIFKTSMAGVGMGAQIRDSMYGPPPTREGWLADWDAKLPDQTYETRYIVTGNLLGNPIDKGQMAYFTRDDGKLATGFVMPVNFDPGRYPQLARVTLDKSQAKRYFQATRFIAGGEVTIEADYPGYRIWVPSSRKEGGKFFLDENILNLVERQEFYRSRGRMTATIEDVSQVNQIIDLLADKGVVFTADRSSFEGIFGPIQPQPMRLAEGPQPFRAKTTATLGRQLIPNPKVLEAHQADEMRIAYGSEKLAEETVQKIQGQARAAVRRQVSRAEPGTLEHYRYKVSQEYGEQKWVSFEGRRLTPGMESHELAELFQVYRSPKQENFHTIYTDENGKILAHNMLSSGSLTAINVDVEWLLKRIKNTAKRLGAARVHFLHNHPSGDPAMSAGDKQGYSLLRDGHAELNIKGLGELMGEFVVINHGRLSYFYNGMQLQGFFRARSEAGDWLDKRAKIKNSDDLARLGATLQYDRSKACLVFTDAKGRVNGWTTVNNKVLLKPIDQARNSIMQLAKAYNAHEVSIILGDVDALEQFIINQAEAMKRTGRDRFSFSEWVRDVQLDNGISLRSEAPALWTGEKAPEGYYTRGFLAEEIGKYDQGEMDEYRQKHIAPMPEKEKFSVKKTLQKLYTEAVSSWAPFERYGERARKAGVALPPGSTIPNALSYQYGVEGRFSQATEGDYVYHDQFRYDEDLGEWVQEGYDLTAVGPSLRVRLEKIGEMAERRGQAISEVKEDWETMMAAQRDLELAGETGIRPPGDIKGVHPEESRGYLRQAEQKYGEDFKELMKLAGEMDKNRNFTPGSLREWMDQAVMQPLLQAGFISQERYEGIKDRNQFYVPYHRLLEEVSDYILTHEAALGVPQQVIKEIRGSERQILDPLQMCINLAYRANFVIAKNSILRNTYLTAKEAGWDDVREIPSKYRPIDFTQKQEIDSKLRPQLTRLANDLGIKVKVLASLRGKRLGQFKSWLKEEVKGGKLAAEMGKEIEVRFATFEATLSHELGHGIDHEYNLVGLLIDRGTPEMKQEMRKIADQRAGDAPSRSYKRYIRKKEEQVAEFVSRYIIDRQSVERLAPRALIVFENFLRGNPRLTPLLNFRLSHQSGVMEFQNRIWARSPFPPEPGTVPYFREGRQRWLKLPADMYEVLQNATPAEAGIILQVARWPAKTLHAGAILNPEFVIGRNPPRDVVQRMLLSSFGFSPLQWVKDAINLTIIKDERTLEEYRRWEAGGGPFATLAAQLIDPQQPTVERLMGEKERFTYAKNPIDALARASSYLENLTRFSAYRQGRDQGMSHADAIHESRRGGPDFARAGGNQAIRYLRMTIPFFGAAIQGADLLYDRVTGPHKKIVLRRLGMMAAVSMLLWLHASRDDRYKELEEWEKNYFWHIPLSPDVPMIRLPKPFEAGILFGSTFERLLEWREHGSKGFKSALGAGFEAATPEIIPTVMRPFFEGWSNYDFFRGRAIEDQALQRLPVQLRAKPWTTETAKAASRIVSPIVDISPVKLEHFVRSWTGGLGANYFLPGIDVTLRKAGILDDIPQPTRETIQQIWGIRSFFTQMPTGYRARSVHDFFERYQETIQADAGWKALWNAGQMEEVDKFLAAHPEAMFARVARRYIDEISKIKKERTAIQISRALTSEQKKAKLDVLDEQVVKLAQEANAFMSQKTAKSLQMPSRFVVQAGRRQALDLDDYYKMVAETTFRAFEVARERPGILAADNRDEQLTSLLRRMRREYKPGRGKEAEEVARPYRFSSLLGQPTRARSF